MGQRTHQFFEADYPEPHRQRARQIFADHPQVRSLFGNEPRTFLVCLGLVASQLGLAFLLRDAPWWQILIVAALVGAFITHALWVVIHECAHNLIFTWRPGNNLTAIMANLPFVIPSAESFRIYHLKHHKYQGDFELDADMASEWEARLVGSSTIRKFLWQVFFPIFQTARTFRFSKAGKISFVTRWVVLNIVVQFAFNALIVWLLGWPALAYLFVSLLFSVGPHPLGARWVQEHFTTWKGSTQETSSYYGPANAVALNVGYHNEHHDFPFIPWTRLPELKALAPEAYDTLHSHRSWTKLWLQFLFDPEVTLWSRVVRDGRINGKRLPPPVQRSEVSADAKADAPATLRLPDSEVPAAYP